MVTRRSKRTIKERPVADTSKDTDSEGVADAHPREGSPPSSPSTNIRKAAAKPSPRASKGRKRSRVVEKNDCESSDDPSGGNDRKKASQKLSVSPARVSTPTKKRPAVAKDDQSDDESSYDGRSGDEKVVTGSDFESENECRAKSRCGRRKSASSPSKKGGVPGRGPADTRTCPHCNKVMSTKMGLKYHIDNFVCRIDQCDDPALLAKAKRKRGKSKDKNPQSKRFRGAIENRVCPECNRVFTSELGLNYHVQHKVCTQIVGKAGKAGKKEKSIGLDTLEPGSKFVTQFGVVEVVKDDRETPTASRLSPNMRNLTKTYQAGKIRADSHNTKVEDTIASQLRNRRSSIDEVYCKGNATTKSIFNAYFGGDPRMTKERQPILLKQPVPPDPAMSPEFFPDRIVECILVPDKRKRFLATDIKNPIESLKGTMLGNSPTRLFLQRRLLTDTYDEDIPTYTCTTCGRAFNSVAGMRYHFNANVCVQRQASEAEKRRARREKVQVSAKLLVEDGTTVLDLAPRPAIRSSGRRDRGGRGGGRKRVKQFGMYPEVLMSLGFKVVKEDMEFTDDNIKLPPFVVTNNERQNLSTSTEDVPNADHDILLELLREQLKHHKHEYERTAADQKHGSMYAGVFKSLGYKKEGIPKRRASARRRRSTKPPPPPKPVPPIIDTRALADEIDAGRYPSMNRYKGDNHSDLCVLCGDGGDLVCCDFCSTAEHLKCIRTRFTVKNPEPEDDFMCHKCIQNILGRRNRAEKRRLEKLQRAERRRQKEALEESRLNPGIQKGMEYPYMAAKGQDVSELTEILRDAQIRLKQALATSKMNNIRRKAMGCYYTRK